MLTGLGMVLALAACGWVALDAVLSPGSLRRWLPLVAVALCSILWSGGELALRLAAAPDERALARQILFLGLCALPSCWLWLAVRSDQPAWWQRRPAWLGGVVLVSASFYASLFVGPAGIFVNLTTVDPEPGPLFFANALYSWSVMALGLGYLMRGVLRRKASGFRMALFLTGLLVPFGANVIYVIGRHLLGLDWNDPTPALLGGGVLFFRASMVTTGMALTLPMSRREVFDQLQLGLLTVDLDHHVVDANRAAVRLLDSGPLRDRDVRPILDPLSESPDRALEVRTFPLRGPLGIVGRCVVISDRTREARTERQLRLAARLEAVGSLTAGIAHEVNNPLAYVRANLSQLEKWAGQLAQMPTGAVWTEENAEEAQDAVELTAEMRDGVERITGIVERLRSFARQDLPPEDRAVDLADAVHRAATLARAGLPPETISLALDEIPPIRANESEIVQVVLNLLVNALQASGEQQPVEVRLCAEDGGALLTVMDRGSGIPPDLLPHIFDPFFTTRSPGHGTGLGLSVSHDIVRRHGGRMEAANRSLGGAVFTVWLPLQPAAPDR